MTALENILSQETIQKLGWTLLHFIWQAAVLAVFLAILLRILRKSTANLRYIIASLTLTLIVLLPVITIKLVPVSAPLITANIVPESAPVVLPTSDVPSAETIVIERLEPSEIVTPASSVPFKQRAIKTLEPALPHIVSGWLIGVLALSLWHLGGWTQLQRLKRRMVKPVDDNLHSKLKVLAQRLRVKQTVQLMESALVQIPTVVGWLRPVILLPASALTGLTSEQLEAILAHELAHIKRYDYLINIMQTIVEILGFYHPAVWWVSHKIRAERENCCDDLAVSISGDRICYAGALTSMEEIRAGRGRLAVAASGGNLSKRIYRLIGKDSAEKTGFSWIPAATAILLIIALAIPTTLAFTNKAESREAKKPVEPQLIKLNTLPDVWKLDYSSGMWPRGMARDLVQLKVVPTPAYEYDESWREERLEFKIRSLKDERIGSILFWGEHRQFDRITLSPGKYLLSYTRERTDPETSCLIKMNLVEFPVDLSRRGTYTLVFSPKLEPLMATDNKLLPTTCTGRVVDSKGNPLTSSQVAAYELYFDMAGNLKLRLIGETVTKADGNFLFETTPSVRKNRSMGAEVVARKEGLAVGWALWPLYGNQKATITLQEPAKLSGKVVDENGTPIPNANVRAVLFKKKTLREEKTMWLAGIQPFNWLSIQSDRDGRFEFNNIPQNSAADLLVTASGLGTIYTRKPDRIDKGYELAEFVAGQTDIKITMPIEARIEGKVVNKKTGAGIPGVTLRVIPYFTPVFFERYLCTTKEDGTFNIGGLRSGKYMIRRVEARTPTVDVVAESGKTTRNVILKCPHEVRNPQPAESQVITPNETDQQTDAKPEAKKVFSAHKLKVLGLAVAMYVEDHDDNLPQNLQQLKPYLQNEQDFDWLLDNAEYYGSGKSAQRNAAFIPIAYDKSLFLETDATNVLFLDFSVRFLQTEQLEKLGIKRAEFLIDARFLAVGEDLLQSIGLDTDSPDKAQALLRLKSELLEASDGSQTQSLILDDLKVSLLLEAVHAHKNSGVLAAPQVLTREGKTAEIIITNNETYYVSGYSEPNRFSEKPQPKIDKVEEGISLSLKPRLTPNKNIAIEFELEITQVPGFEEHKYEGKYPYKLPSVQKIEQATRYIARNGQTLLFGGYKIADQQDGQTEQKDLLILIKAKTVGSSEKDRSVQAEDLILAEPSKTTRDVIVQPGVVQSRIVEPKDNVQEKTRSATEQKPQTVQKFFKLKYYSPSQMAQIIKPLLGPAGYISTDESKGYLLVIDTVENLLRIEKIIAELDVPEAGQTVTEIFEICYGDPAEIVQLLKKLITGRPGFGAIIEPGKQPAVLIPEPRRKWIIAKASAEDIKQIGHWIARLDREEPPNKKYEVVATKEYEVVAIRYADVTELADRLNESIQKIPGLESQADILLQPLEQAGQIIIFGKPDKREMVKKLIAEIDIPSGEFETRVFKLKYSDPNQIKENIDNLYGGTAPGGRARYYYRRRRDSRPGEADTVKVISYPEFKQVTVIASPENMLKITEQIKEWDVPLDVEKVKPRIIELQNSNAAHMAELLRTLFTEEGGRGLSIYNILFGSRVAEKQKMVEPLYGQLTFEEVPGTNKLIVISKIPEAYDVVEQLICDLDRRKMTPEDMKQIGERIKKFDTRKIIGMEPIDAAVYEQLETIVDLSDLTPGMSFDKVIERLKNSVAPPLQIQPIWRDLLENAEVEQATPSGMEPLTRVKLGKALEILLAGLSSTELAKLTYIVDGGVILIGTADMLPPKMLHRIYDISDLVGTAADADALIHQITTTIEPDSWYKLSDKGEGTIIAYPLQQPKNFAIMQSYDIHQQIEHFLNGMRSSRRKREKAVPAIKPQEMQKIRQEYINNDPRVKSLSEKIANAEAELIAARQKFTPSHHEVQKKALMLQFLKKRLDESKKEVGRSFDDTITEETYKTYKANQEKIAKLLDELREPNLPPAPEAPLITSTFIDYELTRALKDIASMAGVTIIPDEKVVGLVNAELKNVPLEKALDIVLAGTPYIVKKTPYYYLVTSAVEPPEIQKQAESAKKLSSLGHALLIYANDHEDKYPDSLHTFTEYLKLEDFNWVITNVEYLARGKTITVRPDIVIAYDKKLLEERKGTNVLFNDSHVEFIKPERLKALGISANTIQIETRILSVSEDFLKDIGLDANSVHSSDAWSEHLLADPAAEPNSKTYSLILDDLHISFLLKAAQAHKGARMLISPRATVHEDKTAEIKSITEYPVLHYIEPNDAYDEPQPKIDYVEIGTHIWLKPELTPDNQNVNLYFKLEMSQLKGIIEGKYQGKYPYQKPIVDVISTETRTVVPNGKTLLIGGQKITEQVSATPILNRLPVVGEVFRSRDKTREQKTLLILVKPVINPQQKATKILPGQEDSEEHIKSLARRLETKLNRSAGPK